MYTKSVRYYEYTGHITFSIVSLYDSYTYVVIQHLKAFKNIKIIINSK